MDDNGVLERGGCQALSFFTLFFTFFFLFFQYLGVDDNGVLERGGRQALSEKATVQGLQGQGGRAHRFFSFFNFLFLSCPFSVSQRGHVKLFRKSACIHFFFFFFWSLFFFSERARQTVEKKRLCSRAGVQDPKAHARTHTHTHTHVHIHIHIHIHRERAGTRAGSARSEGGGDARWAPRIRSSAFVVP